MSGAELILLLLGLIVGFAVGYGVRAYRSHARRRRYRMSTSYHTHGDSQRPPKRGEEPDPPSEPG